MDIKDIKRLLDAIAASEVSELTLETGDYKLSVKRGTDWAGLPQVTHQVAVQPQVSAPSPAAAAVPPAVREEMEPAKPAEPAPTANRFVDVTAPIVGTFYEAPSPDAPPYVKVGDRVEAGAVLCIIEAMKLMNEIETETAGTVAEILVHNEEPVEYGQVLFRIEPS